MKNIKYFVLLVMANLLFIPNVLAVTLGDAETVNKLEINGSYRMTSGTYLASAKTRDGGSLYLSEYDSDFDLEGDITLAKYDKDGALVFRNKYSESNIPLNVYGMFEDDDGNFIIYGSTDDGSLNFESEAVILKTNSQGEILHKKTVVDDVYNFIEFETVVQTSDGNYIAFADDQENPDDADDYGTFAYKFDKNLNILWSKNVALNQYIVHANPTNNGGVILGTYFFNFYNERDYSSTKTVKIDKDGNMLWEHEVVKSDYETFNYGVFEEENGDIVSFISREDEDCIYGEHQEAEFNYLKVIKYNKDGNVIFNRDINVGYNQSHYLEAINVEKMSDNVYYVFVNVYDNDYSRFTNRMYRITTDGESLNSSIIVDDLYSDNIYSTNDIIYDAKDMFVSDSYLYIKAQINSGLYRFGIHYNVGLPTGFVAPNGSISLEENIGLRNSTIAPIINADLGYELDKLIVNGKEIEGTSFKLLDDSEVKATFKAIPYKFIEGMNTIYNNKALEFKLDGEYSLLDKVYINNEELDSSNYTTRSGSTYITLKDDYLKGLDVGTYEIKVSFTNGSSDTTNFTIEEQEETPTTENTDSNNNTNTTKNPDTFDNIISYMIIGIISILGIISIIVYKEKICTSRY